MQATLHIARRASYAWGIHMITLASWLTDSQCLAGWFSIWTKTIHQITVSMDLNFKLQCFYICNFTCFSQAKHCQRTIQFRATYQLPTLNVYMPLCTFSPSIIRNQTQWGPIGQPTSISTRAPIVGVELQVCHSDHPWSAIRSYFNFHIPVG